MDGPRPESSNEVILDRTVLRQVRLERVKRGVVAAVVANLNGELDPILEFIAGRLERIRTRGLGGEALQLKAYRELVGSMDERLRDAFRRVRNLLGENLEEVVAAEAAWAAKLYETASHFELVFKAPPVPLLRSIPTARPFQGKLLKEWASELSDRTRAAVRAQINIGLTAGEGTDQIIRRLRGTRAAQFTDGVLEITRRNAEAVVRTAVQHTVNHARQAVIEENREFVQSVRWVSTLDGRTSQICISLDGREYSIDSGPRPPAHFNCRSAIIPVLKSWQALGLKDPSAATRASMNGQVPAALRYGDWLRRQTLELQDEVLGPGKAALFRRGVVPVDRFIDSRLRPLTLKQLERLEADILGGRRRVG